MRLEFGGIVLLVWMIGLYLSSEIIFQTRDFTFSDLLVGTGPLGPEARAFNRGRSPSQCYEREHR
jgi:hypothetical protein